MPYRMIYRVAIAVDPRQATEQWQENWLQEMLEQVFVQEQPIQAIAILSSTTHQLRRLQRELAQILDQTVARTPTTHKFCTQLADPRPDDTAVTRPIQEAVEGLGSEHDLVAVIGSPPVLSCWLRERTTNDPRLRHG